MNKLIAKDERLDTTKKFVGDKKDNYRIEIAKMQLYSGKVIATEKDYSRGYTSISLCGKRQICEHDSVNLVKSSGGDIYYQNLLKCGSVWRCPICAYKISNHKQKQVDFLNKSLIKQGYKITFLTLTLRHHINDKLKFKLNDLLSEFRKFQSTSFFKKSKKDNFLIGIVKTTEITYSERNGWHPHLHILLYHKSDNVELFHDNLISKWVNRKKINGLKRSNKAILVDLKNELLSSYLTKWNCSNELTSTSHKSYKELNVIKDNHYLSSVTPFTILKNLALSVYNNGNLEKYKKLYREYSNATYRKHFCSISSKLKNYLSDSDIVKYNMLDKNDVEILNEKKPNKRIVSFGTEIWKKIIKFDLLHKHLINSYIIGGIADIYNKLLENIEFEIVYDSKSRTFNIINDG